MVRNIVRNRLIAIGYEFYATQKTVWLHPVHAMWLSGRRSGKSVQLQLGGSIKWLTVQVGDNCFVIEVYPLFS
jgi:hypothetical protein